MQQFSKVLKFIFVLSIFTQISCQEKKDNNNNLAMTKYEWTEGTSAPLGYPMEVYKGGIECEGGEWVGLSGGLTTASSAWGTPTYGMSSGFKSLPTRLDFVWMSYNENQFYHIDSDIDINKIREFFSKGYEIKGRSGKTQHLNYDMICVGLAPGGIVVVWVAGVGVQKEVGRYQGKKVTIPDSEIAKLDSHENRFWRKDYLDMVRTGERIVPKKIQEENKNKPIPFGLWDVYRTRFSWKLIFDLPENSKLNPLRDVGLNMINGEREQLDVSVNTLFEYNLTAMPKSISFSLLDKNNERYGANCDLKEKSIFEAFQVVFGDKPNSTNAELIIKVNESFSFFTVLLKGENGKKAFIQTENLEMFKSKLK